MSRPRVARLGGRIGRGWPRSVRARTALAAAVVATLVFGTGLVWMRQRLYDGQLEATAATARGQVDAILDATTSNVLLAGDFGSLPYELVGGDGVIVSSSQVLKPFELNGRPVMPAPGRGESQPLYRRWVKTFPDRAGGGPLSGRTVPAVDGTIAASLVRTGPRVARPGDLAADVRYRVYVFVTPTAANAAVARIDPFLLVGLPVSVLLVAATAGYAVRRSLRPVEAIRVRTAAVTARNPRERVQVPASGDEIEALARTINATLGRVEQAAADQRRFVADAAHELRAPLANLLTGLEVAQAYPAATVWPDTAASAVRSARRLHALVDDLLLLARLDTGEPARHEVVDLAAIAADVCTELRGITVPIELLTANLQLVVGDQIRLHRALRNLVDNAARHARTLVRVELTATRTGVVVDVHDDGPGVPVIDRDRVFDRFTRLDAARARDDGGAGLGLAIAREIALAHGGTLIIVDQPRQAGTTFRLTIARQPRQTVPQTGLQN